MDVRRLVDLVIGTNGAWVPSVLTSFLNGPVVKDSACGTGLGKDFSDGDLGWGVCALDRRHGPAIAGCTSAAHRLPWPAMPRPLAEIADELGAGNCLQTCQGGAIAVVYPLPAADV